MNYTKLLLFTFYITSLTVFLSACNKSSDSSDPTEGNWVVRSEFDGDVRSGAVSFVIGDTAYMGTGATSSPTNELADFWKYNVDKDYWTQVADFPGTARHGAVAFSIGQNGYVGTGTDLYSTYYNDFYKFTPTSNSWTPIAPLGGSDPVKYGRRGAVAFSIGQFGYVTTGFNNAYLKDFYRYNPSTDTWETLESFSGQKREGAVAFVYQNKAYVVTGYANSAPVTDFMVYDPTTGWDATGKRDITNKSSQSYDDDYTDIVRQYGVAFVLGDKAYIATGESTSGFNIKTWAYDFANDSWSRRTAYEVGKPLTQRAYKTRAVSFVLKNRAFVGTGQTGSSYQDNFDEFKPNETYNEND